MFVHLLREAKKAFSKRWKHSQQSSLFFIVFWLLLVIVLHSFLFYFFENTAQKKLTLFDSFWVTLTTLTTVGYGDISASTVGGRWTTILLGYLAGLALFASIAGELLSLVVERVEKRRLGMMQIKAKNHCLIVNFPNASKVQLLIEEVKEGFPEEDMEFVVITDNIDSLPFEMDGVSFVRGDVTDPDVYKQANVAFAKQAIVLAENPEDKNTDAITVAAVSTIEILNPSIRTVAECVYGKHMALFHHVRCDRIVQTGQFSVRLVVQEFREDSISKAFLQLMDQKEGSEFYSLLISEANEGQTFQEALLKLVNQSDSVLPVGFIREGTPMMNPNRKEVLRTGDRLLLLSEERPNFSELLAILSR